MISTEYVAIKPDEKELLLTIELGIPELDPISGMSDYRCKFSAPALGIDEYIYGVDAIQSHCMTLKRLRLLFDDLISKGWKFYFPGHLDMEVDIMSILF
ncbi:hypothetical protein GCM10007978_05080 [Shewanella hanedai]|uniref:Uncharacterized protein n=1 Tax=Shewanella hanedai TaxID=25 RepID=A0A553JTR3_SHEHA|nr:hypothetical protein [Shewanella hanedai]TRY15836.1 hypothetical protein FN961_02325 [Shewanella hanedai]GGI70135.1 hypothetical protein GCM10007978_05080 [Shewanella hanedai]